MTSGQIVSALHATLVGARLPAVTGFSIDTRTLLPGDLFFAIRGQRLDGHDFVATAFQKGAGAVCLRSAPTSGQHLAACGDTTWAPDLARHRRHGGKVTRSAARYHRTTAAKAWGSEPRLQQ